MGNAVSENVANTVTETVVLPGPFHQRMTESEVLPAIGAYAWNPTAESNNFVQSTLASNQPFLGSFQQFLDSTYTEDGQTHYFYEHSLDQLRGTWGVDTSTDTAWAVLDVGNGIFAVVPNRPRSASWPPASWLRVSASGGGGGPASRLRSRRRLSPRGEVPVFDCGRSSFPIGYQLPTNALTRAIAAEAYHVRCLMKIQALDGVVQAAFRLLMRHGRQRIVHGQRPAFLLKSVEHRLLIRTGDAKLLNRRWSPTKNVRVFLSQFGIASRPGLGRPPCWGNSIERAGRSAAASSMSDGCSAAPAGTSRPSMAKPAAVKTKHVLLEKARFRACTSNRRSAFVRCA